MTRRVTLVITPETGIILFGSAVADDIRAHGWSVAVHNDYYVNGVAHTFWLFTHPPFADLGESSPLWALKGEGKTDSEALDLVRHQLAALLNPGERDHGA